MALTIEQAIDSVYLAAKTAWEADPLTTGVEIYYDETPKKLQPSDNATDKETTPMVKFTADIIGASQATLGSTGNRRFRRTGVLTVVIYTPIDKGRLDEDRFVKIVFDALEGECTPEGVELFAITPLAGFDVGAYRVKQLNVEFEYDEIK